MHKIVLKIPGCRMEAQYTLASALSVLFLGADILTSGGRSEAPSPLQASRWSHLPEERKWPIHPLKKNPVLPPPALLLSWLSPPVLGSFYSFFSFSFFFFFILPAEHLPVGHSISFLVFGE